MTDRKQPGWAIRRPMPSRYKTYRQTFSINGHKFVLQTGEYNDGTLGELCVEGDWEDPVYKDITDRFLATVSEGLQHGESLEKYVNRWVGLAFEPSGVVMGHPKIKKCTGILDFIFRDVGMRYLGREDLACEENRPPILKGMTAEVIQFKQK